MTNKKVLLIEDDPQIIQLLTIHLEDLHCDLQATSHGTTGLQRALDEYFDLIILDLMLPGIDGLEICRQLRSKENHTPILMLTARSEEIDRVLGLEIGADDYMTKPFSIREFIARVKAIFRRTQMQQQEIAGEKKNLLSYDELSIDVEKRKVLIGEEKITLSPKEFELLVLLASNPGKSYNRSRLLNLIWGYDFEGYEHTVNSHINRLRAKIEPDMANPKFILTTWGVGYQFNEEI